jgi:hypothetical protein
MEKVCEWYRASIQGKHLSDDQLCDLFALAEGAMGGSGEEGVMGGGREEGVMGGSGEEGAMGGRGETENKGHKLNLLVLSVLYNVLRNGQGFDGGKTERLFLGLVSIAMHVSIL